MSGKKKANILCIGLASLFCFSACSITPNDSTPAPVREETDSIGHKAVYFEDGSFVDVGRVVDLDFTPSAPQEKYGYRYLLEREAKGETLCKLYIDLVSALCAFHDSQTDVVLQNGYFIVATVQYAQYGLSKEEATSVWKLVYTEYPEFFWLKNQVRYDEARLYLLIAEEYASWEERAQVQRAVEASALECDGYLPFNATETERALVVYEYVITTLAYAYEEDGKTPQDDRWAHSVAGIGTQKAGVCEAYAKTFDYFCDLFSVECITVSGVGIHQDVSVGHAWNLVKLENEWRAVDATWGDKKEKIHREWFGVPATEFAKTHQATKPENGWGVQYYFGMPPISEERLSPVRLTENGEARGMCVSVDSALRKMQNEGSRYEITLHPDTLATQRSALHLTEVEMQAKALPKSAGVKITGRNVGEERTTLTAKNPLTLYAPLTVENLSFFLPALQLHGGSLTSLGEGTKITVGEAENAE